MPALYDLHLSSDFATAQAAARSVLEAEGFTLASVSENHWTATRGSLAKTLLLGAMAGKNFHLVFDVQFYTPETGTVVRLNRNLAGGALKGGAIGAAKSEDVFNDLARKLGQAFVEKQALLSTTEG